MVRIKLFAKFREKFGDEMEIEAKTVGEILEKLGIEDAVVAVNLEVAHRDTPVDEGDEIAVMPRFSGG